MPFTPAHVVAAVPLAPFLGRHAVVSALAIGSITPDLGYFLPIDIPRWQTHELTALVWFCLPVGLATWAVFHAWVAPLVHDLSPASVRSRLPETWRTGAWPTVRAVDVAFCLALGAVTHLVWDSFTHTGTPLVRVMPELRHSFVRLAGLDVTPIRLLQHASTLLGLLLLARWGRDWLRAPSKRVASEEIRAALRVLLILAIVAPGAGVVAGTLSDHWPTPRGALAQARAVASVVVFTGGTVWCMSLVLVAAGWRVLRPRAMHGAVVRTDHPEP